MLGQFDAGTWLETVRAEGVTNAFVVPTMLASVIAHALRLWPHVGFANAYGLTETSSTIAILGPEDHRAALESPDPAVRARLGSAGRVIPAVDVRILDPSGAELPPGTVGRICVRGEQVSGEYSGTGSVVDDAVVIGVPDDEWGQRLESGRGAGARVRGGRRGAAVADPAPGPGAAG